MTQNSVLNFTPDDAFAAYSLPNSVDHFLVFANDRRALLGPQNEESFIIKSFMGDINDCHSIACENKIQNGVFQIGLTQLCDIEATSYPNYSDNLIKALEQINQSKFDKVVLSKIALYENTIDDIFDYFQRIKGLYPAAFVFFYNIPNHGCWIGASPELLLKNSEKGYTTMALAGTQRNHGLPMNLVKWTGKEVREQSLIEDFVKKQLDIQKVLYEKSDVTTVTAGRVLHLCSEYHIDDSVGQLELAKQLHPGPAICGYPQKESLSFIVNNEGHDRQDYCGYIGVLSQTGQTALYVNLRSMKMFVDKNALFVGGGITNKSVAELEWEETNMKAETLTSAFENILV